ncbi:MAG: hypothetical protein SGCHY_002888 [Lobulomycetales sp.]
MEAEPSTVAGVRALMASNLGSRGLTFLVNLLVTRLSPPGVLGIAVILLDPLAATVLFLAREHARVAALRGASSLRHPLSIGLVLSIIVALLFRNDPNIGPVVVYLISALLELCSESMVLKCLCANRLDIRARAEAHAFVARCLMLALLISALFVTGGGSQPHFLYAYSIAQIAYSFALYRYYYTSTSKINDIPESKPDGAPKASLSITLFLQGLLKHLLTEGDKFLILLLIPDQPSDMGSYAFASNFGSLVARIIMAPIEDGARIYFATRRELSGPVYAALVRANILLGAFFVTFGPWYTDLLVRIVGGKTWTWVAVNLLNMGASGFVLANIANLSMRAAGGLYFARGVLQPGTLRECLPTIWLGLGFVVSSKICRGSWFFLASRAVKSPSGYGTIFHLGIGVTLFALMAIFVKEGRVTSETFFWVASKFFASGSAMRFVKSPYSLSKQLIRMSWSKDNLYNLVVKPPIKKLSDLRATVYQQRWTAKRELRAYHVPNISERQLLERHFTTKIKLQHLKKEDMDRVPAVQALGFAELERRVDVVVFRSHFAKSIWEARSLVVQGHVSVNGEKSPFPCRRLNDGDMITVNPAAVTTLKINDKSEPGKFVAHPWMGPWMFTPAYLEVSYPVCSTVFLRSPLPQPDRVEVPSPLPPSVHQLGFEWYSTIKKRGRASYIKPPVRVSGRIVRLKNKFDRMVRWDQYCERRQRKGLEVQRTLRKVRYTPRRIRKLE